MTSIMRTINIILSLLLLSWTVALAQDNHFTLYNNLPFVLNPGQTAAMTGEMRAGVLYRNQWRAVAKPFTTVAAYADRKFVFKKFDLGIGLSILNDRSGPEALNVVEIFPSASIGLRFRKHVVVIGVQPGLVHKKVQDVT